MGPEQRLYDLAQMLVQRLLNCRFEPYSYNVQFPNGTLIFRELYALAGDEKQLILLLDTVARRLTNEDHKLWAMSACDPALVRPQKNWVNIVLHPARQSVEQLQEVSSDVYLFALTLTSPYPVLQLHAAAPDVIAANRNSLWLKTALDQWQLAGNAKLNQIRAMARNELRQKQKDLTPEQVRTIKEIIDSGRSPTDFEPVLTALFFMGSLDKIFKLK